jgi:hypothetical protein
MEARMIRPRQVPLVDLMLIAKAELRSNHSISSYAVAEDEWLTFRRCSSCKLYTEIETVSPSYRQVSHYENGVRHFIVERAAPPYEVCTACCHFLGYIEDAPEPVRDETAPVLCLWCGTVIEPILSMQKIVRGELMKPLCRACCDDGEEPKTALEVSA